MPRRLLGVFMLLLASVFVVQAQGDAVLFTVGTDTVYRREFECLYRTSSPKDVNGFLEKLVDWKRRVQYARELKLDTMDAYRKQKDVYRQAWKRQQAISENRKEKRTSRKEWIRLMHVSYPLKQNTDKDTILKGKLWLDSLYVLAQKGHSLGESAKELPWVQTRYLLKEWQEQLKGLESGQWSKPFVSPLGIHMVAWVERTMEQPQEPIAMVKNEAYRLKEIEESLLAIELERYWQRTIVCSERELEAHFKKHRSDYGGGTPHFRGAVIHCQNKKEAKAIKKYLKQYPEALWEEAMERIPVEVSAGCRMERGLFAIGANPYVDHLAFKCGTSQPLPDYPYAWVLGKKMKKGPDDYRDVRSRLENDCLKKKKEAEKDALKHKYQVEINDEVLKTVNHDRNK